MSRRLRLWYAVSLLLLIGLFALVADIAGRRILVDQLLDGLSHQAASLDLSIQTGDDLEGIVAAQAAAIDARITVIDGDGVVLADSHADPASMANHADRPEVRTALGGNEGRGERVSSTTGAKTLYIARPISEGTVIRVAVTSEQVDEALSALRRRLLASAALAGAIGLLVVSWVGRRLSRPLSDLVQVGQRIAAGDLHAHSQRSAIEEVDALGQTLRLVATDLGARIQEVETARETLERVLTSLPSAVALLDADDRIIYSNPRCGRFVAAPADSEAVLAHLTPVDLQAVVRSGRSAGVPVGREITVGHATLEVEATPLADRAVLMVVVDVTEARRLDQVRRDLVADASHELKTPVAAILASAEAMDLAVERNRSDAGRFARQIADGARRLARIVDDLLDLSRLETTEIEAHPIALDAVVDEEARTLETKAGEAGVLLRVSASPVVVQGSAAELALVVRNLCDNAIRYSDPGATVTVTLDRQGSEAHLRVADTGIGIPSRSVPRLFERFYRVDPARSRSTGGTGLGLAIVKHVVERHGGKIEVESELHRGSTFLVRLPLAEPAGD